MASLEHADTPATQYAKEVRLNVSSPDLSNQNTDASDTNASHVRPSKFTELWIRFMTWIRWYPTDMRHEEKSLTLKLDLSILIFGCLSFFTKYLDQQSITNAYVR